VVSRLEKYKNVDVVVKAFNQIPNRKLVIIGDGSERKKLERLAGKNIKFLGYRTDTVVNEYYQNCRLFIASAHDEDFGITPIEAMAAGKPVLALRSGGFLETITEDTGEFYDENTPESLLKGLIKILEKTFDSHTIREYATTFSTENFKEKMKAFIDSIMK